MNWPSAVIKSGTAVMGDHIRELYDLSPVWPHVCIRRIMQHLYIVSEVRFYRNHQLYARFHLQSAIVDDTDVEKYKLSLHSLLEAAAYKTIKYAIYNPKFDKIINDD